MRKILTVYTHVYVPATTVEVYRGRGRGRGRGGPTTVELSPEAFLRGPTTVELSPEAFLRGPTTVEIAPESFGFGKGNLGNGVAAFSVTESPGDTGTTVETGAGGGNNGRLTVRISRWTRVELSKQDTSLGL